MCCVVTFTDVALIISLDLVRSSSGRYSCNCSPLFQNMVKTSSCSVLLNLVKTYSF